MSETIVIRGGRVVDARNRRTDAADILIEGDTIRAIGPPGLQAPEDARIIPAGRRLLIPGLINAHTHSHGNLSRSTGDRRTLELALNGNPAVREHFTLEDKHLAANIGAVEMVSKGCTACYDLVYEFPTPSVDGLNAIAEGYDSVGMRAVVAPMMADGTFYEAVPGLLDALPDSLRLELERKPRLFRWEGAVETCREAAEQWRCSPTTCTATADGHDRRLPGDGEAGRARGPDRLPERPGAFVQSKQRSRNHRLQRCAAMRTPCRFKLRRDISATSSNSGIPAP